MFARNAHFRVKSLDITPEFDPTIANHVVPLLRKQEGFKGEITLSNPGSMEQIATSLWDNKDHAEIYDSVVYPQVLKILASLIDGTPKIRTYADVTLSLDHGNLAVDTNSDA